MTDYTLWMIVFFIIGYILITLEHFTRVDKATVALMMGILLWVIEFQDVKGSCTSLLCLGEHISSISQIILFILGALTVVEIINQHKGFLIISDAVKTRSKRKLLWVIGFLTFFLSAILDNLTTTIVMISLLRKIIPHKDDRLLICGGVVVAANAGGAWTPIGDVTTTMLWIGGQISAYEVIRDLLLPSLVCMLGAFGCLHFMLKGSFDELREQQEHAEPLGKMVFFCGVGLLMFVPVFKVVTGLPPFMGMLFALSTLWIITDLAHSSYEDRYHLRVPHVLSKIEITSVLFFLGILLAVDALDSAHILQGLAQYLDNAIGNLNLIAAAIGLASAVVDNVPLVAASMGMYDLVQYPMDDTFWKMIAYCAGTGGSILLIGSAAGVVFMGLENVSFFWYLRYISLPALIGYFLGMGLYLLG